MIKSLYWTDEIRFQGHPIFAFENEGNVYIWRYDLEYRGMQNQCAGIPLDGKTISDHLDEYVARMSPTALDIHRKDVCISPGKYFPRIYRPGALEVNFQEDGCPISDIKAIGQCLVAANIIFAKLKSILEVVELNEQNLQVYGHEIRNLLLLSSMEFESVLSAILRENSYPSGRWNTTDYVKLCDPLHLSSYEVKFNLYPDFRPISPFLNWDFTRPTQSLAWYDAYNKTKHDRELNIGLSTLEHAIHSVASIAVLLKVQFGENHSFWHQGELANINVSSNHDFTPEDYYVPFSLDKTLKTAWQKTCLQL
jgi:hypothetical protein